jgi:hypothetical protein
MSKNIDRRDRVREQCDTRTFFVTNFTCVCMCMSVIEREYVTVRQKDSACV